MLFCILMFTLLGDIVTIVIVCSAYCPCRCIAILATGACEHVPSGVSVSGQVEGLYYGPSGVTDLCVAVTQ